MTYYQPSEATISANISETNVATSIILDQHSITGSVGEPVTISGQLVYYDPTGGYGYAPLPNAPVELYVGNTKKAQKNTDSQGRFSFSITFDQQGTYTVRVRFPGMSR